MLHIKFQCECQDDHNITDIADIFTPQQAMASLIQLDLRIIREQSPLFRTYPGNRDADM